MIGFRHRSLVPTVPHTYNDASAFSGDDVHHATSGSYKGSARLGGRILTADNDLLLFFRATVEHDATNNYQGAFCWRYVETSFNIGGHKQENYTPTNAGAQLFDIKDLTYGWQHVEARLGNLSIHFTEDGNDDYTALFSFKVKETNYYNGSTMLDLKETDDTETAFPKVDESAWSGTPVTFNNLPGAVEDQFRVEEKNAGVWDTLNKSKWNWTGPSSASGKGSIEVTGVTSSTTDVRVIRKAKSLHCAATMTYSPATNAWSNFKFLGPITNSMGEVDGAGTLSFFRKPSGNRLFAISPGVVLPNFSENVLVRKTTTTKLNHLFGALSSSDPTVGAGRAFKWNSDYDDGVQIAAGDAYDINDVHYYGMGHKVQSSFFDDGDGYGYAVITGRNTKEKQTGDPSNDYPSYGKIYRVDLTASEDKIGGLTAGAWETYPYGISFMRGCIDSPGGGGIWGPQIFKADGEYYAIAEHVGALMNSGTVASPTWIEADSAHPDGYDNPLTDDDLDDLRAFEYGGPLDYHEEITSNSLILILEVPSGATLSHSDVWPSSLPFPTATQVYIRSCQDDQYLKCESDNLADAELASPSSPGGLFKFHVHQHGDFFRITTNRGNDNNYLAEPNRYINSELNVEEPPLNLTAEPTRKERTFVFLVRRPDEDITSGSDTWPAFHIIWADSSRQLFNDNTDGLVCVPQRDGNSGSRACWYIETV